MKNIITFFTSALVALLTFQANAQYVPTEETYYPITKVPVPEGVILEVGGLTSLPNGSIAASTRRGEIWIIENPTSGRPRFVKFASGMHEVLGLQYVDGSFICAQRTELTRVSDTNGDGKADMYETIYSWPVTGNYHEYSFGPVIAPDGDYFVTLNLGFFGEEWWAAKSRVPWRGWALKISPEGEMEPWATGMRSPAGIGVVDGEFFYADNQGDWVGSGSLVHLEKGDFTGHPAGLVWSGEPNSPVSMTQKDVYATVNPRSSPAGGPYIKPENLADEEPFSLYQMAEKFDDVKIPAVWLPHGIFGISTSEIITIDNDAFGPFRGQLLIGDQGQSKITRVFLEKVNGEFQGAAFAFREGFRSGVLRMQWGNDNTLYVGQTNRGWGSTGPEPYGLERVKWNGETPFEIKAIRSMPDGFELEFTKEADPKTAGNPDSYAIQSFIYKYHPVYGSPAVNDKKCRVKGVRLSEDGMKARLVVEGLREKYIHEIVATVKDEDGRALLHGTAYYTLNSIASGDPLEEGEYTIRKVIKPVKPVKAEKKSKPLKKALPGKLAKRTTTQPEWWDKPDVSITLGTVPGLQYDKKLITVKAGSRIKITFNNKDDMPHNFLLVKKGTADEVGMAALKLGIKGLDKSYVPDMEEVLFHTKLVQPGASDVIYLEVPADPGDYTYVCTYPGHYVNMRGILRVTN